MSSDYLDSLQAALSFDPSLARRVRREFEDHLSEVAAADAAADLQDAERRAIALCGDPSEIAAEFAAISLARRTKRLAMGVVLALLGVLLLMKGRTEWYAAMGWVISDDVKSLAAGIGTVARDAFWIATFVGMAAWAYGSRYRLPSDYIREKYPRYLSRFCAVTGIATIALTVSVLSDAALATIRLISTHPSMAFFVPISSIGLELTGVAVLILLIHTLIQRAIFTARLKKT
ncbi:MAG TPA: hypothetical protein VM782_24615 [Stellaceae bacterium]|nr:hypothetical protein [Stellaceae bacterium]